MYINTHIAQKRNDCGADRRVSHVNQDRARTVGFTQGLKFSKVSTLLNLPYTSTTGLTFEKFHQACVRIGCRHLYPL